MVQLGGGVTLLKFRQYYGEIKRRTSTDGPFVKAMRSRFPDAFWKLMKKEGVSQVFVQERALKKGRFRSLDLAGVKTLEDLGKILAEKGFNATIFKEDGEIYLLDDRDEGAIPYQWER
jgi:hypothetical protein